MRLGAEVLFEDRVVKKSISEEVTFEQKGECGRGASLAKVWESVPVR